MIFLVCLLSQCINTQVCLYVKLPERWSLLRANFCEPVYWEIVHDTPLLTFSILPSPCQIFLIIWFLVLIFNSDLTILWFVILYFCISWYSDILAYDSFPNKTTNSASILVCIWFLYSDIAVDSGCAWAQITCKHTDDTQTKQNTGNPPERWTTKQLRMSK